MSDISVMQLESFFNDLSTTDQRKIFIDAFRRTAKPLVNRAKANAPSRTGNLRKSIGTLAPPKEIKLLVGAMKGRGKKGWHGHLVENGTQERFRRSKTGTGATGKMVGSHFFEQAYKGTESEIEKNVETEYYIAIDRAIIRINKKK